MDPLTLGKGAGSGYPWFAMQAAQQSSMSASPLGNNKSNEYNCDWAGRVGRVSYGLKPLNTRHATVFRYTPPHPQGKTTICHRGQTGAFQASSTTKLNAGKSIGVYSPPQTNSPTGPPRNAPPNERGDPHDANGLAPKQSALTRGGETGTIFFLKIHCCTHKPTEALHRMDPSRAPALSEKTDTAFHPKCSAKLITCHIPMSSANCRCNRCTLPSTTTRCPNHGTRPPTVGGKQRTL